MAKKDKLIICVHCGEPIAAGAKTCPHCGGKNKKPIYKRVWFWFLIAVVLLTVVSGSGSKSSGSSTTVTSSGTTASTKAEAKTAAPEKSEYYVGDTLHDGSKDIVYISSGEYREDNQFMQPKDGYRYIFLNFAFINTSSSSDTSVSFYSFECYADGYACDAYYGGNDDLSATLSPGRSTSGSVYFEVPVNAKEIEVEYEANFFTDRRLKFVYEGDKDSGYVLQANANPTEGALKVGNTISSSSLNITYLNCFADTSDNMFITPKEGFHYITCELELENVSSSDTSVSSFSFDCYADGKACDSAFFRDDNLSATLSAGRKAKGTVTFEVPVDATVIEVEYLTNVWTSNRVVFDASIG